MGSLLAVVLSATVGLGGPHMPASQAPDAPVREPRANRAAGVLSPGEVVAMLDAYAVVQAQDALQLNDTQYGPFVVRLKKLQETRRRNQQARNHIIQELRRVAGPQ